MAGEKLITIENLSRNVWIFPIVELVEGGAVQTGTLVIGDKADTDARLREAGILTRDPVLTPDPVVRLSPSDWKRLGVKNRSVLREYDAEGYVRISGDLPPEAA